MNQGIKSKKYKVMKARIIISIIAVLLSINTVSANPNRMLVFRDALGRTLFQPVKAEEASEELPEEVRAEFFRIRSEMSCRVFDISGLMKPEEEDPLPFDLENEFRTAAK